MLIPQHRLPQNLLAIMEDYEDETCRRASEKLPHIRWSCITMKARLTIYHGQMHVQGPQNPLPNVVLVWPRAKGIKIFGFGGSEFLSLVGCRQLWSRAAIYHSVTQMGDHHVVY